jgi:hypothetical protein
MLTLGWLSVEDLTDDRFLMPEPEVDNAFSGTPSPIGLPVLTGDPPPPPPVLVPGMIPMTVHSIVAPGGTAKTTIVLLCMIRLITGRTVLGKEPAERGPCLFVTAEDDLTMVKYRIRSLCDAEGLSDAERKLVAEQLHVEDVSGKPVRLAELDARGNIVPSGHVDSLISKYTVEKPVDHAPEWMQERIKSQAAAETVPEPPAPAAPAKAEDKPKTVH